jgi:hypothetical protein
LGAVEIIIVGPNLDIFGRIVRCQARRSVPLGNNSNSINNNVFSKFNDVNLILSMVSECSMPPGVGPQGGRRTTATTMIVGALTKRCD